MHVRTRVIVEERRVAKVVEGHGDHRSAGVGADSAVDTLCLGSGEAILEQPNERTGLARVGAEGQ